MSLHTPTSSLFSVKSEFHNSPLLYPFTRLGRQELELFQVQSNQDICWSLRECQVMFCLFGVTMVIILLIANKTD